MLRDNRLDISGINMWSLIGGTKEKNESFEETSLRKIEEETSLKLRSVKFLETLFFQYGKKNIYHATLTADNLNNIRRGECQNLDFFSLAEAEKLPLTQSTKSFLANHKDLIERMLHN